MTSAEHHQTGLYDRDERERYHPRQRPSGSAPKAGQPPVNPSHYPETGHSLPETESSGHRQDYLIEQHQDGDSPDHIRIDGPAVVLGGDRCATTVDEKDENGREKVVKQPGDEPTAHHRCRVVALLSGDLECHEPSLASLT